MAKELPYFRFTASEWLNDDISLEPYELKGLFIDICAYYWFKDCSITLAMLEKRFSNAVKMINELTELKILKIDSHNFIIISFLDKQYDLLSKKRIKRQEAGKKGGLQRASNAKAMLKQKSSYKDKDKDKKKDKDKEEIILPFQTDNFIKFWDLWKQYKKEEHKFTFKSEISEQSALKKIGKDSENNENTAIEMIEYSIANGYKGLFKDNNYGKQNRKQGATIEQIAESHFKHFGNKKA